MRIAMIGSGYVGLVSGACFSEFGHDVICVDKDPGRIEQCPTCGFPMRSVHDVFHRATHRALERSGRAEVVAGEAERRLMELGGGLGALLRYSSPVPQAVR